MTYAHVLVLVQKDKPVQFFQHPAPPSHPVVIPLAAWHVAAND